MLNEPTRFVFEPNTIYGDKFLQMRNLATKMQTINDITELSKLFTALHQSSLKKDSKNRKYPEPMTSREQEHFRNALRYIKILLLAKIKLTDDKELKESIRHLRNAMTLFLDNK